MNAFQVNFIQKFKRSFNSLAIRNYLRFVRARDKRRSTMKVQNVSLTGTVFSDQFQAEVALHEKAISIKSAYHESDAVRVDVSRISKSRDERGPVVYLIVSVGNVRKHQVVSEHVTLYFAQHADKASSRKGGSSDDS